MQSMVILNQVDHLPHVSKGKEALIVLEGEDLR